MIPRTCKRLAEVDFPIATVSKHAASGAILLTPNERRVAEDRRDCYWLYVVTNCAATPTLQEPTRDPARFPWHEVIKVQHYWLEVNAMTQPMQIRESGASYKVS